MFYTSFNVSVTDIGSTDLTLVWNKATNATGYQVTVSFPENVELPAARARDKVYRVNSTQTSFVGKPFISIIMHNYYNLYYKYITKE